MKHPVLALFALAAVTLGGCSQIENWQEVKPLPEPKVRQADYIHPVPFAAGEDRLTVAERERIDSFLAEVDASGRDDVVIQVPADGRRLTERRLDALKAYLDFIGHSPSGLASSDAAPDSLVLVVRRYVVELPPCPDWSGNPAITYANQPSSNFGCATATNLGLMIDDPRDLMRGRTLAPAEGSVAGAAVERYRSDEVKPFLGEGTSGGGGGDGAEELLQQMLGGGE